MTLLPSHVDKAKDIYVVPENITRLEKECFKDCINLTSITLHDKITYIGDACFQNCPKLKEIIIPDSVEYLGHSCFKDCINLTDVKLGNGFDTLHRHTFYNCKLLTKVVIPNSVKKYEEDGNIFDGCYNLQTIILSDNCNDIYSLFNKHNGYNNGRTGTPYKNYGYTCTIYGNFSTTDLNITNTSRVCGNSSGVYVLCNIILKPKSELNVDKLNKDLDLSFKELNSKVLLLETKDINSNTKINELEFNNTKLINQMDALNIKINDLETETEKKVNDKLTELETENIKLTKSIKILESCYILIFVLIGVIIGTLLSK